jgi:hypothetical protein
MAGKDGASNKAKGADFGRGTKNMSGEDYTKILEGQAPKAPEAEGKPDITDKTS